MIGTIEQAIITRLMALSASGALGYSLRQIKTYGGELKDQSARAKIADFPSLWLAFEGGRFDQPMNASDRSTLRFVLLVGTRNLRNEQAARHGGAAGEVGAYQILMDMAGLLAGYRPAEGVGPITLGDIQPLSVEESGNGRIAVYGLTFSLSYNNPRLAPEVDLTNQDALLKSIHTNWDLPPTGNVGPVLPDDANADQTSHVTGVTP